MEYEKIQSVRELEQELIRISKTDEVRNTRLFALALATLLNEVVPQDRTIDRVEQRAYGWEKTNDESNSKKETGEK